MSQRTQRLIAAAAAATLAGLTLLTLASIGVGARSVSATISLRTTKLGPVLVSTQGHTLYMFMKDVHGASACYGSCMKVWPPLLTTGKATAGSGLNAALISTTKRNDGSMQVTYNKHPLYRYVHDTSAGDTYGEALFQFGAKWYALNAKGSGVIKRSSSTSSSSGGGYGSG
jgi:predicted lipoprotein with Yx(FWY)xxD motif